MDSKLQKKLFQNVLLYIITIAFLLIPGTILGQGIIREIDTPGPKARGLTWDGQYLWCSDAIEDSIFKIDPVTGQVMHSIFFDINAVFGGGLAWNGDGSIWVTRLLYFHRLDALTGDSLFAFYNPYG